MNKSILGRAVTVLLAMTVQTGFAAEAVHVPATAHAAEGLILGLSSTASGS